MAFRCGGGGGGPIGGLTLDCDRVILGTGGAVLCTCGIRTAELLDLEGIVDIGGGGGGYVGL